MLCMEWKATGTGTSVRRLLLGPGCNNNWSMWGVGTRLQWDVTKSFYLGVEVSTTT